jgi:hypothetical protein
MMEAHMEFDQEEELPPLIEHCSKPIEKIRVCSNDALQFQIRPEKSIRIPSSVSSPISPDKSNASLESL